MNEKLRGRNVWSLFLKLKLKKLPYERDSTNEIHVQIFKFTIFNNEFPYLSQLEIFHIYTFVDCLVIFANHNFDKICPPPPKKKERNCCYDDEELLSMFSISFNFRM